MALPNRVLGIQTGGLKNSNRGGKNLNRGLRIKNRFSGCRVIVTVCGEPCIDSVFFLFFSVTLDVQEQEISLGFVGNFGDSVGRTAMYNLLHKVFGSSSIRAVNIGGRSKMKMPSHRAFTYEVTNVTASSESSPLKPEEPTRKSPRVKTGLFASAFEKRTFDKDFTPDVVLDYYNTEMLCVEVKFQFDIRSVPQLQYLLMPVTMKQGVALGLLICTKSVLLMKCYTTTAKKKTLKFESAMFKLQTGSLAADMEDVVLNIYCHLRTNYPNIIIN